MEYFQLVFDRRQVAGLCEYCNRSLDSIKMDQCKWSGIRQKTILNIFLFSVSINHVMSCRINLIFLMRNNYLVPGLRYLFH
jgi:hypothetical protein